MIFLSLDDARRISGSSSRKHSMSELWDDVSVFGEGPILGGATNAIDVQVTSLAAAMRRRDELALVHRLTPEILARILMLFA